MLGFTEEQIEEALEDIDGFPLNEDDLEDITGGIIGGKIIKPIMPRVGNSVAVLHS